jgi:hypothetical protein
MEVSDEQHAPAAFPPEEETAVRSVQEVGRASEPIQTR